MERPNDSSFSSQSNQFDIRSYGYPTNNVRESSSYEIEREQFSSFPQSQDEQLVEQEQEIIGSYLPGMKKKFKLIRWKSGKSVDPRLFTLLEYFRELYDKRRSFFKKIFPELYDEFVELYEKIGGALDGAEDRTIQRSLSFGGSGSPRMSKQMDEPMLRNERFRVTTPDFVYVGQGIQGVTNSSGSSEAPKQQ